MKKYTQGLTIKFPEEKFQKCFEQLKRLLTKCIYAYEDYIEHDITISV